MISNAGIPISSLTGVRLPKIPHVAVDARQGMELLTRHLVNLGHRRLLLLGAWPADPKDEAMCWPTMNRKRGFEETIISMGGTLTKSLSRRKSGDRLEGSILFADKDARWTDPYALGYSMTNRVLSEKDIPDVILYSNDDWAHGAMTACSQHKIRVPEDLAITGFDDIPLASYGAVPLTTVAQPLDEMAKVAVKLLSDQIRGEEKRGKALRIELPCRLIVRRSCGALPENGSSFIKNTSEAAFARRRSTALKRSL